VTAYRLTPKQEKFCAVYLETGNASEAYRQAYDCKNMAEATINSNASRLLKHTQIAARIAEAQDKAMQIVVDTTAYDKAAAVRYSLQILEAAADAKQYGAAVSANKLATEIMGYITQKSENIPTRLEDLSAEQLDQLIRLVELRLGTPGKAAEAGEAPEAATRH